MLNTMFRNVPKVNLLSQNVKSTVLKNMSNVAAVASEENLKFETLAISSPAPFVFHVQLNRPKKMNAMNNTMWIEIGNCFNSLSENPDCRAIVLSGSGKIFGSGIDLTDLMEWGPKLASESDVARKCKFLLSKIKTYQNSISSLENCVKPVIAAVHNACVGGAINLITAADIRYCSKDAWFQVKEVDIGMAADVGVLQRLPKIIGSDSLAREFCYTGRKIQSKEALECGLVSKVSENYESLLTDAINLAEIIAKKSPVAVQGTKQSLVYARDHSVQEGLDQMALMNQVMLQSEDLTQAVMAQVSKDDSVTFSKL